MVTPVNTEKTVALGSERTQSRERMANEQPADGARESAKQGASSAESAPEVESARHLYQLENQSLETVSARIETPEQARNLLDQLLQQFSDNPESALKAQGSAPSHLLDKLLSAAPA